MVNGHKKEPNLIKQNPSIKAPILQYGSYRRH